MDGPISLTGTVHLFMTTWRRWKGWKIQRPIISEVSEEFCETWQFSIKYFRMIHCKDSCVRYLHLCGAE